MLNPASFTKCAPSLATNIKQCGTVTICDAIPLDADNLTDAYMQSGDYRVMEALLFHDMEIKQCEAVQNGLYDFLMANKVNLSKRLQTSRANRGLIRIAPFILARQHSPINNEYWLVSGGAANGSNWQVTVASTSNIPYDVRSFPIGQRVYIDGKSEGGSSTKTAWEIIDVIDNGNDTGRLVLRSQNTNSNLDSDKLGSPNVGILRRGTPNVSDFEKFCAEAPAYLNWKDVPFWTETTRHSMCKSDLYDEYRKLLLEGNALYREYGDLDDIQKNRQLGADWQRRLVNSMFWNKALPNQTLGDFNSLDEIETFDGGTLGVDGGRCIGKRANAVGIYEQLAECGRIFDLQGAQLNLPALFEAIYHIIRVREGIGNNNTVIDVFTDSITAEKINTAMIKYYNSKSDNTLRLNMPVEGYSVAKKANFGFLYRSYPLFWPQGVVMNVVNHRFFDDYITAASLANQADTARVLWILDFAGIYPGILASNQVVQKTGDLKTLAAINPDFACVMRVPTQEQTLTSLTWTMIVDCPMSNLVLENFSDEVAEHASQGSVSYVSGGGQTTTTTSAE